MNYLSYIWVLFCANIKSNLANRKRVFWYSSFMFVQNFMFFLTWIIFFNVVSDVKGWQLTDIARMFGVMASAVGVTLLFFSGVRTIARRIIDGSLDMYITRPRSVLPALLMSEMGPASLGDIVFALTILFVLGDVSCSELPFVCLLIVIATIIFVAASIIVYSLPFWLKGDSRFSDQMFEMLIITSANIIHGQSFAIRVILFTVLPGGFISYLPVELIREFDGNLFAILVAAMVFYAGLAKFIFNAGLRRYVRNL